MNSTNFVTTLSLCTNYYAACYFGNEKMLCVFKIEKNLQMGSSVHHLAKNQKQGHRQLQTPIWCLQTNLTAPIGRATRSRCNIKCNVSS